VSDPDREIPLIEAALAAAGIPVLQRRALAPSLENVFISVTGAAEEGLPPAGTVPRPDPNDPPGGLS